jgi:hypothetical protein
MQSVNNLVTKTPLLSQKTGSNGCIKIRCPEKNIMIYRDLKINIQNVNNFITKASLLLHKSGGGSIGCIKTRFPGKKIMIF